MPSISYSARSIFDKMLFMDLASFWLIWFAAGVASGLFCVWTWFGGAIVFAQDQGKTIPGWMFSLTGTKDRKDSLWEPKATRIISIVLSLTIGIIWFGAFISQLITTFGKQSGSEIVIGFTSYPLAILLIWILPICILERYLARLESNKKTG